MFETLFEKVFSNLLSGGQNAIISILFGLACVLGWWILRMEKIIKRKDDRLDEIVDNYHKGNIALTETINQLRLMFYEIRTKI